MWLSGVQATVEFIRTNRPDYVKVAFEPTNLAVFKRIGEDVRTWNHFNPFDTKQ